MDIHLKWFRKIAESGDWAAVVLAESEEDVRALHVREQVLVSSLAHQYPGAYRVEALSADFVPPAPLDALQRRDFAAVEEALGLLPKPQEGKQDE